MGVDYTPKLAYGVSLSLADVKAALQAIGQDDGTGSEEEWADCVADHLGCKSVDVGNAYERDGAEWIIGPLARFDNEAAAITVDQNGLARLREFAATHWPDKPIRWVVGLAVW